MGLEFSLRSLSATGVSIMDSWGRRSTVAEESETLGAIIFRQHKGLVYCRDSPPWDYLRPPGILRLEDELENNRNK